MTPDPTEEASRWLSQARQDLADASYNAEGGKHNLACFLCQQAAEKAAKAFLYARGMQQVWGHSVGELLGDVGDLEPALHSLQQVGRPLDQYYLPTRYPNALPGGTPSEAYGPEDSERALRLATLIMTAIGGLIGS